MSTFTKRKYRRWTDKELELLGRGKIPAKRTYGQCYLKAHALGIEPPDPPTGRKKWTKKEMDTLRSGKLPEGRSFAACFHRGYMMGIRVMRDDSGNIRCVPMEKGTFRHEKVMARDALLFQMHAEGLTYDEIAARIGVSKQCVYARVKRYRAETKPEKRVDDKKVEKLMKAYKALAG